MTPAAAAPEKITPPAKPIQFKAMADRKAFALVYSKAVAVCPTRSPKPILESVRLVATVENGSWLESTDLEVGVRLPVLGLRVDADASVILPRKLGAILGSSVDTDLAIEATEDKLTVRGLRSRFDLPTDDPQLFPDCPAFDDRRYFEVSGSDFDKAITRTMFATDVESTRYALGGCLFEYSDEAETMTIVATDGRRLAKQVIDCEAIGGMEMSYRATSPSITEFVACVPVVPYKALRALKGLIDPETTVGITVGVSSVTFRLGSSAILHTRTVEGRFPKYADVFPATCKHKVEIPCGQLLAIVSQASIVTSDESRGVDFTFSSSGLTIESQAADVGASKLEMDLFYSGDDCEITFDPRYLVEALKTIDPVTSIRTELNDGKTAAVFKTDDGYSYVVMPLTRER